MWSYLCVPILFTLASLYGVLRGRVVFWEIHKVVTEAYKQYLEDIKDEKEIQETIERYKENQKK